MDRPSYLSDISFRHHHQPTTSGDCMDGASVSPDGAATFHPSGVNTSSPGSSRKSAIAYGKLWWGCTISRAWLRLGHLETNH